jgi:hypothetical protein
MKSLDMITAERERQIDDEGWDDEHDDRHTDGELARAAICYTANALGVEVKEVGTAQRFTVGNLWPWSEDWDKRDKHDDLRSLTIAGALIAAEIDRRLRERDAPKESLTLVDLRPGELFKLDNDIFVKTSRRDVTDHFVVCVDLADGEEDQFIDTKPVIRVCFS